MQKSLQEEMQAMQKNLLEFTARIEEAVCSSGGASFSRPNNHLPPSRDSPVNQKSPQHKDTLLSDPGKPGGGCGGYYSGDGSDEEHKAHAAARFARSPMTQRPQRAPTLRDYFAESSLAFNKQSQQTSSELSIESKPPPPAAGGGGGGVSARHIRENRKPSLISCHMLDKRESRFLAGLNEREKQQQLHQQV